MNDKLQVRKYYNECGAFRYYYDVGEVDALIEEMELRISDLENLNKSLSERVIENDEIRKNWEQVEQVKAENEQLKKALKKYL